MRSCTRYAFTGRACIPASARCDAPQISKGPAVCMCSQIKGHVTGFGNPTWKATHGAAAVTARAVQLLLDAGAEVRGKTHMDELAYSLNGENVHYGTPKNPAAPGQRHRRGFAAFAPVLLLWHGTEE